MTLFASLVFLRSFTYLVVLYCTCAFLCFFLNFGMLLYFITFTPKFFAAFALAVAAISAKLGAILQNKTCKILQFLCCFANCVHNCQF